MLTLLVGVSPAIAVLPIGLSQDLELMHDAQVRTYDVLRPVVDAMELLDRVEPLHPSSVVCLGHVDIPAGIDGNGMSMGEIAGLVSGSSE